MKLAQTDLCEKIKSRDLVSIVWLQIHIGKKWLVVPRLLGVDPDGRKVLVCQTVDTDRHLDRDTARAGDRWRRLQLGVEAQACAPNVEELSRAKGFLSSQATYLQAIPANERQGISRVLCES